MKIEWLDDDFTKVRLTRGMWWWKRTTIVISILKDHSLEWVYEISKNPIDSFMKFDLMKSKYKRIREQRREIVTLTDWARPVKIPTATRPAKIPTARLLP